MTAIPCTEFRAQLERALRGRPEQAEIQALAWHGHLVECAECRALLEAEEALEELLASLPAPRLPRHLATRVLARLTAHREGGGEKNLDRLLDLDHPPAAPTDLAARVLAGLSSVRADERLDSLLDQVPAPNVPAGLGERVLQGLVAERRPASRFRLLTGGGGRRLVAAAAVLVLGLVAWRVFLAGPGGEAGAPQPGDPNEAELIAALDVLQRWDLLMSEDPNLQLASVSPLDEVLYDALDFDEELEATEPGDEEEG